MYWNCSPFDVVDHAEETFSQNDTVTQGECIDPSKRENK